MNHPHAAALAALSDPVRCELLDLLAIHGPSTASQLADHVPITRQGVMKHLHALADVEIVTSTRRGRSVLYSVDPETVRETARWLTQRAAAWDAQLHALKRAAEACTD